MQPYREDNPYNHTQLTISFVFPVPYMRSLIFCTTEYSVYIAARVNCPEISNIINDILTLYRLQLVFTKNGTNPVQARGETTLVRRVAIRQRRRCSLRGDRKEGGAAAHPRYK